MSKDCTTCGGTGTYGDGPRLYGDRATSYRCDCATSDRLRAEQRALLEKDMAELQAARDSADDLMGFTELDPAA